MTIYDHVARRLARRGMTDCQAHAFLIQFGRTAAGRDFGWRDVAPYLSAAQCERIDAAAVRWLSNPDNAAKPEPPTVRAWRDGKALAAGKDEGPEGA
jgi:hypothetical protein